MNNERSQRPAVAPEPPSDLELMMFFDGELDEPRRTEIAAFVASDLRARTKIAGLRVAAAFVQDEADQIDRSPAPSPADDIAGLVMARIAANGAAPVVLPATPTPLPVIDPARLPAPPPLPALAPANDNRRRLFVAVGGLVAAAAAVLAVWSQRPSGPPAVPPSPVAAVDTAVAPVTARPAPAAPSSTDTEVDAAALAAGDEGDHGVEVAAVNFGAHMGSIFYVPSGSIEAKRTTTVVWLADDAGE